MADKNMEAQISVEFEEATSRQSLNSGETINTLWGKVKRWLSDLKVVCFSGSYNDLSDTPTTATKDTDGLMSAEDKSKLDGVATGANKTIVDTILSNTSTNPVQNKVVKQAIDKKADKSLYGDTTINVGRRAGTPVGDYSTAEGFSTEAGGQCSHAEGAGTSANGQYSHAEGAATIARGQYSHAEGNNAIASGDFSHAEGFDTRTTKRAEHASGQYNQSNSDTLFSIGDGTADNARHNAFEITTTGGKLHDKDIATTDLIPTELPANGGNADTVGGIGIADLRQITQTVINTLPAVPNGEGDFFVICDLSDTSFPYWYGHLSIRYGSYTGEYVAIFKTTGNDNKVYYNTYLTNHWSGWQEISATPIKSTTFSGTTNNYGDMLLFNKSEKKIPLFVSINDSYCIPLLSGSSDYYVHIINVDNTVAANVSKSGTLYYSEFKAVIV